MTFYTSYEAADILPFNLHLEDELSSTTGNPGGLVVFVSLSSTSPHLNSDVGLEEGEY